MRDLKEFITIKESRRGKLRPTRKDELKELINQRIEEQGPNCDLNDIDVSKMTDMSYVFSTSPFSGDISKWDVSSVVYMRYMFDNSPLTKRKPRWYRE